MSSREKVRASHLLVKHQGSRRPASWKDPEGKIIQKTTRDDAVAQLQQFKSDIESGKSTLADLASKNSDCSSAKRGGDLGMFLSPTPLCTCSDFSLPFPAFLFL